ncbi:MAG: hypothetical protein GDA52_10200 [Rhodobacteraceae bacterium]|nr:hypothetical protein [Paracoccaceae bacterium]
MSYFVLLLGVALFAGAHWFKRLAPDARARLGQPGKGLVSLLLLAAIILMVIGYRNAEVVNIWEPPDALKHITNLLVLIGFWLFALSVIPGRISARVRHKQLAGVKAWALGHLLANGDLASILLLGGMLGWAVGSVILINRAQPAWDHPADASVRNDAIALGAGLAAYVLVAFIHNWLGVYPFPF